MSGHDLYNSPLVYDNGIYLAAYDGSVCAINATTNQLIWGPISTGDEFCGSSVADNGVLYVAGEGGTLYAFDLYHADSGNQLLWSCHLSDRFEGTPAVSGGLVYVAGMDGGVYAFTAGQTRPNGPLWFYQTGSTFVNSPVVSDGELYVSSLNGWVYAFTADGISQTAPLWNLHFADWFYGSPLASSGMIYLAGEGGVVYAFPESYTPLSLSSVENYTVSTSVAIYGTPVYDNGVVYFICGDGYLRAFNASNITTGTLWSFRMLQGPDIGTPAPILDNGIIYSLD
jgi:outer membrane protein assembly factor BamB